MFIHGYICIIIICTYICIVGFESAADDDERVLCILYIESVLYFYKILL